MKLPSIGELVAFNRSGDVVIGTVMEIGNTKHPRKVNIKIKDINTPEISCIKNPRSFISLAHLLK